MALEIERKFLVISTEWKSLAYASVLIEQAYLVMDHNTSTSVRIRQVTTDTTEQYVMTLKSKTSNPLARNEVEFEISPQHYAELYDMHIGNVIHKIRYLVKHGEYVIEVDEFQSTDLVLAEIELQSIDDDDELPDWIGAEVTEDHRYKNTSIAGL